MLLRRQCSPIVAKSLGKFGEPKVENWDDNSNEVTSVSILYI
jgi:hypothetical protein